MCLCGCYHVYGREDLNGYISIMSLQHEKETTYKITLNEMYAAVQVKQIHKLKIDSVHFS